ncbi:superoxide dismutase family protein [Chiayiivirga flava]|uniref:Superoxide dismutase [Cu-Zn] n=1 Tax=Chiayiivirga flava TaxID=659595 RepID=A0A7W8D5Q1_9GAMM|nr:superoxide dismutase family protein [Chiayiivirga flava]MBB5208409.1 Cu-Zn family superoxide dismutase [Chiayiivirga flava]
MRTSLFLAVALALSAAGCDRQTPAEPPAPTAAPAPAATPAAPAPGTPAATTPAATPATTPATTLAPAGTAGAMPQARVELKPTQNQTASGGLVLESDGKTPGVRLHGTIEGLTPNSTHGFHIHENGDCSAPDGSSAGGHFNPDGKSHGDPASEEHHVGDIFAVTADANGVGQVDARADRATLSDGAPTDVLGKAVIVHEKADDYKTQPTGDAGGRIACGVIQ